jgi:hypothetical protein
MIILDEIALIGNGSDLDIVDITDPSSPFLISSVRTFGVVEEMIIDENIVFIACYNAGLAAVDISNINEPTLLSELPLTGYNSCLFLNGDYLYFAVRNNPNFQVIDVSNPSQPELVNQLSLYANSGMLRWNGYLLAASENNGFSVLDISSPSQPNSIFSIDSIRLNGLFIKDDLLFLLAYDKMYIYDLSKYLVQAPQLLISFDLLDYSQDAFMLGDTLYISAYDNIIIYDIANIYNPVVTAYLNSGYHSYFSSIFVKDDLFYLTSNDRGLIIGTHPGAHVFENTGIYRTGGHAMHIAKYQGVTYTGALYGGINILDDSDRDNIHLLNRIGSRYANFLAVNNDRLYTIDPFGDIHIYSMEDPVHPNYRLSYYYDIVRFNKLIFKDNIIFALCNYGLLILDASDPDNFEIISFFDLEGSYFYDFALDGSFAYVAIKNKGVDVIDLTDLSNPILATSITEINNSHTIAIAGNILFSGDVNSTKINIFDITDPYNPSKLTSFYHSKCRELYVKDELLYIAGYYDGFSILDYSDLANVKELAYYNDHKKINDLYIDEDEIYLCTENSGYKIITVDLISNAFEVPGSMDRFNPVCFPNPAKEFVTIDLSDLPSSPVTLTVLDANGREVFRKNFENSSDKKQALWHGRSLQGFPIESGLYFLRCTCGDGHSYTSKLIWQEY